MKRIKNFVITAFAATSVTAMAAGPDTRNEGYLVDTTGAAIVTSGTGLCWRDSEWTQARAVEPCDPTKKPRAVAMPAAAMAPAPVAAVQLAPPVERTRLENVSFSGDALFAFDRSTLNTEGMAMLDDLVLQLDGATYDSISVTGHTDRIGSDEYNQKLSERRAQAVKDYLVGKNIQAESVDAEGKGETESVTAPGDCQGAKGAKLVACLQPDRRVDVAMNATKTIVSSR